MPSSLPIWRMNLPSGGELQDLVAVIVAADPDIAVAVDMDAVLVLDPVIACARPAPMAQQIAVRVEFHHRRRGLAAFVFGRILRAPFSSSSSVAGRCRIQMLPSGAVAIPATWPRIQFSGSGFGQNGSGWNAGGLRAGAGCAMTTARPAMGYELTRHPTTDHAMTVSPIPSACDRRLAAMGSELRPANVRRGWRII